MYEKHIVPYHCSGTIWSLMCMSLMLVVHLSIYSYTGLLLALPLLPNLILA